MEYMLMFCESQEDFARRETPQAQARFGNWLAYIGAMREAGVMRSGNGLQGPMTGTSLGAGCCIDKARAAYARAGGLTAQPAARAYLEAAARRLG